MLISSENAGKVTVEGEFICVFCKKSVGSNSIICQFCSIDNEYMRGELNKDSKFRCQTCANQQTDIAEDCPGNCRKVLLS